MPGEQQVLTPSTSASLESVYPQTKWLALVPGILLLGLVVAGMASLFSPPQDAGPYGMAAGNQQRTDDGAGTPSLREQAIESIRMAATLQEEDPAEAERLYRRAQQVALDAGDNGVAAWSLRMLGDMKSDSAVRNARDGDGNAPAEFDEAEALLQQALEMDQSHGYVQDSYLDLLALAALEKKRKDYPAAEKRYREIHQIASMDSGMAPLIACSAAADLGDLLRETEGDVKNAQKAYQDCLATYRDRGDAPREAYYLWRLGVNAFERLAFDEAIESLEKSVKIWDEERTSGRLKEWNQKPIPWWTWVSEQWLAVARILEMEDLQDRDGVHLSEAGRVRAQDVDPEWIAGLADEARMWAQEIPATTDHMPYAVWATALYHRLTAARDGADSLDVEQDLLRLRRQRADHELAFLAGRELAAFYLERGERSRARATVAGTLEMFRPVYANVPFLNLHHEDLLRWQRSLSEGRSEVSPGR